MNNWKYKLRITHLFTESEEPEQIKQSMNAIANVLERCPFVQDFDRLYDFRELDDLEEANYLIDQFYDFCDANKIWIVPREWYSEEATREPTLAERTHDALQEKNNK